MRFVSSTTNGASPRSRLGFTATDLRFNLSHSQDLAMYAFTLERDVGVDIEMIRAEVANERVAENFFSRREVETLRALPREHQAEAFFNCWTRKEAYVKARGQGLSIELDELRRVTHAGRGGENSSRRRCSAGRWSRSIPIRLCGCDGNAGTAASNRPTALALNSEFRHPELFSLTLTHRWCKTNLNDRRDIRQARIIPDTLRANRVRIVAGCLAVSE